MSDLTPEEVARLRELAEAATPGPWGVGNRLHIGTNVEQTSRGNFTYGWLIAEVQDDDYRDFGGSISDVEDWPECLGDAETDAAFIAAADPPTILALLAALDEARAETERLTENYEFMISTAAKNGARAVAAEAEVATLRETLRRVESLAAKWKAGKPTDALLLNRALAQPAHAEHADGEA